MVQKATPTLKEQSLSMPLLGVLRTWHLVARMLTFNSSYTAILFWMWEVYTARGWKGTGSSRRSVTQNHLGVAAAVKKSTTQKVQRQFRVLNNEFFDFVIKISNDFPSWSQKGRALIHSSYLYKFSFGGRHTEKKYLPIIKVQLTYIIVFLNI